MPIIDTIEPNDEEGLRVKIFATENGEDYVITRAVQEHLPKTLNIYESQVKQTKEKAKDIPFAAEKCIVFLIMGWFMLEDGVKIKKAFKGHVVEFEEGLRLGANSAAVLVYVHDDEREPLGGLGKKEEGRGRCDVS